VTEWTRQAVGPLVAAGRCECEHLANQAEPLTRIDIEAAFLLAVPLVEMPTGVSGSCRLAVESGGPEERLEHLTGVEVEVERGEVVSCAPRLEPGPGTWATGSVDSWVAAILRGRSDGLRLDGGDAELARALIEQLHRSLP
jgi:hypothetical protein